MSYSNSFYPDSHIEIINASVYTGRYNTPFLILTHYLPDLGGMAECDDPMMVEMSTGTPHHESDKEIQATVT